jgi:hypothetical protein
VYTRALVDDLMNVPYNWVKSRMVRPADHLMRCLLVNRRSRLQAAGTAKQCIAVELLEIMNNQTGPYKESETIDEEDIKRITGVLYGGTFSLAYLLATLTGLVDSRNGHRSYSVVCLP